MSNVVTFVFEVSALVVSVSLDILLVVINVEDSREVVDVIFVAAVAAISSSFVLLESIDMTSEFDPEFELEPELDPELELEPELDPEFELLSPVDEENWILLDPFIEEEADLGKLGKGNLAFPVKLLRLKRSDTFLRSVARTRNSALDFVREIIVR